MTETRLCECCEANPGNVYDCFDERECPGGKPSMCSYCANLSCGQSLDRIKRNRARRAKPKAELEALRFYAADGATVERLNEFWHQGTEFKKATLNFLRGYVDFFQCTGPVWNGFWSVRSGSLLITLHPSEAPRVFAELLALRDGYSNATPPAPFAVGDRVRLRNTIGTVEGRITSMNCVMGVVYWTGDDGSHRANEPDQIAHIPAPSAVEPKPNPLRGLAEAMRELGENRTCGECKAAAPAYRFVHETRCAYCLLPASFGSNIDHLPLFHVQPAVVEEVRQPWDWYADPNAPDGVA